MSKLFLTLSFIILAGCSFLPGWPDAIRCGGDTTNSEAAIFIFHGVGNRQSTYAYRQVYSV